MDTSCPKWWSVPDPLLQGKVVKANGHLVIELTLWLLDSLCGYKTILVVIGLSLWL